MPPSILVAEDTDYVADLLKLYLTDCGYDVRVAENGEQAWQEYQRLRPDLVLTDLVMPRMNGASLINLIKERDSTQPVMIITSQNPEDLEKTGAAALAKKHSIPVYFKPFDDLEDLLRVVRKTLQVA